MDMLLEYGSDVTILYLQPVQLVACFSDGVSIALMSVFCTLTWFAANVMSERIYAHTSFSLWYFAAVLGFFSRSGTCWHTFRRSLLRMRRPRLMRAGIPGSCAGK